MDTSAARTIDQAIARVRAFAAQKGWKKSRFAIEAGLTDTTLRDFNKPDWNPTADTLRRLEAIIPPEFMPGDPLEAEPGPEPNFLAAARSGAA